MDTTDNKIFSEINLNPEIKQQLIWGNAHEIIARLPDKCVDAIITDPLYDDTINIRDFERICKGNILMFCKPENQYFKPDEYLFWIKTPSTKNYINKCGRFVEMILVRRQGKAFTHLHWSQMTGVYDDRLIYPASFLFEKPIALIERLVNIYTNENDLVLDCFMGIGTTGIACRNLNRRFIGIEQMLSRAKLAEERIGVR